MGIPDRSWSSDARPPAQDRPAAKGKPKTQPPPDCPDWLEPMAWQRFIDHRRAIKKPLTAEAAQITLDRLSTARQHGWRPEELIENAIANGWQGCVYPDKHFQPPPIHSAPGGGRSPRREPGISAPLTASGAEFDVLLRNLSRPVIEGELSHASH